MEDARYLISEMARKVEVEAHVLRYWEEELKLPVRRNEMGHRYYTREDVERFREIKRLKEKGLQLRAIKTVLYNEKEDTIVPCNTSTGLHTTNAMHATTSMNSSNAMQTTKEEKAIRLQMLLKNMISDAVRESSHEMIDEVKDSIVKEMDYQFRVLNEEEERRQIERDRKEEEHYKKIDELLRGGSRKEGKRKKHSIF